MSEVVSDKNPTKIVPDEDEFYREVVWGKDEGFCAWCVNGKVSSPVWEYGVDSQGDNVKYACCKKCAADRGVKGGEL